MKKLLLIVAAVVVLLVAVALIAPMLIPMDTYKQQIARQVEAATGRQITIEGDLSLSILPRTQVTANQVQFANAAWADAPQMAELEQLQVRVNPFALLSSQLEIESFVLQQPVIHLAKNAQGEVNWQFEGSGQASGEPTGGDQPARDTGTGGGGSGTGPLQDITLNDVRLVDGTVTYRDAQTGQTTEITDVNMTVSLSSLDSPMTADGALTWNGETIDLEAEVTTPRQLMAGNQADIVANISSNPVNLSFDGDLVNAPPRRIQGEVELDVPSIKQLADWAGSPISSPEGTLETFRLAGTVDAKGQTYGFSANEIVFDEITGEGQFAADLTGDKPWLSGKLALAEMNLTPYLPAPTEKAEGGGSEEDSGDSSGSGGAQDPAQWNDDPIDLSALHAVNVDFDLSVEGIQAREVTVGRTAMQMQLQDGRLQADLSELNLYDGTGKGRVVVNARQDTPSLANTFQLQGLNAQPFLTDVAGFERLEGTGAMQFDVQASGKSQKALVENLNGTGAINFQDGAISGVNLAQMVRNVKSAFQNAGSTQKTDFAELSGTFDITDGVLKNQDLLLLNPLLRVRGEGQADIGARTVNYRLTPKAVATTEGQGGQVQEQGVAVPVIIEGPWHNISYRPDLQSVIRDAVKNPEQIKKTFEKVKEGVEGGTDPRKVLEGLTGGGSGSSSAGTDSGDSDGGSAEEKAKDALKNLLGN
ncbi:AsmA family protein [Rhodovibrio salinarum]|uniref:AsmA family protein n=1 Tax=Rhodovibrio salinarum TaxID=1087 RepID=A0A934QH93_9PROT|nr:AsmA family protein [Rhodovibrio salinarum]MBK1696991.1 AsmA family protein [Rhodovibrio salinarum]